MNPGKDTTEIHKENSSFLKFILIFHTRYHLEEQQVYQFQVAHLAVIVLELMTPESKSYLLIDWTAEGKIRTHWDDWSGSSLFVLIQKRASFLQLFHSQKSFFSCLRLFICEDRIQDRNGNKLLFLSSTITYWQSWDCNRVCGMLFKRNTIFGLII